MKILFFISEFDRFNGGQRSLLQLVKNLSSIGIDALVVFPAKGKCSKAFADAEVPIKILKSSKPLMKFGAGLMKLSIFQMLYLFLFHLVPFGFRVWKTMKQHQISILHCNTTRSLLIGGVVPRIFGKKLIWHVRGELTSIPKRLLKISEILATRIILVASALKNQVSDKNNYKCRVIYNAIDKDTFHNIENEHFKNEELIISTFAAITPFKGYHHLIEAIAIVNKKLLNTKVKFRIIGDTFDEEYYTYLKRRIFELNITNIEFVGWVDQPEQYYISTDLVLLPTVQEDSLTINGVKRRFVTGEGLPRTILEAMFFKIPVIATKVAGTSEQVEDGKSGWVVEPSNPAKLAEAIIKASSLSAADRKSMGEEGFQIAQAKFSNNTMLKSFLNLVQEIR